MATKTIELMGILEWAKVFEENRDQGEYDVETDGATTVDLIMSDEVLQKMKDAGIRKQPKVDPDGRGHKVKFKRAWRDKYDREWAAGPPSVYGPSGKDWSLADDGEIGNGSVGVVYVEVYDTKMGKGCRLSGVQVIDHVAYEGGAGSAIKPKDYTQGQAATPPPAAQPAASLPDAEIPF